MKTRTLFDFEFISVNDLNIIVDDIIKKGSFLDEKKLPFFITPNVDQVVQFAKPEYKYLRDIFLKSAYILPDGTPIVWSSWLFGKGITKRLTGSDFVPLFWNKSKTQAVKVLALTNSKKVTEALLDDHPKSFCYTLPFIKGDDKAAIAKIVDDCAQIIIDNDINVVLVGISFPKQNILAWEIFQKLQSINHNKSPLYCMIGASLEFYLSHKKRAPVFMQKVGLEWLHRFFSEPGRLFKRYFIDDVDFFRILAKEFFKKQK